jgi:hypothetical protein
MKKIDRLQSNDIKFDTNVSYNDNFADWLTEMVNHWAKNYTGCTFEIRQVGTEGTQVEIESIPKPNINFDCSSSLNTDLSNINKITYTKKQSETKTYYVVTWKTELKTTPKKEDSLSTKKSKDKTEKNEPDRYAQMFGGMASKAMAAVTTGVKGAGVDVADTDNEGPELKEHQINKRLLEEIHRIKELLK